MHIILCFYNLQSAHKHTPLCDPLWPHYFLSLELLYFAVGQVGGNDMCGFGASVIEMKLPTMQHHQPAQLRCTGIYIQKKYTRQDSMALINLTHSAMVLKW